MAANLGAVARDARRAAGLTLMDIANRAGVSQGTIHHFETRGRWSPKTDEIVAAYAREVGISEKELWRAALDRA